MSPETRCPEKGRLRLSRILSPATGKASLKRKSIFCSQCPRQAGGEVISSHAASETRQSRAAPQCGVVEPRRSALLRADGDLAGLAFCHGTDHIIPCRTFLPVFRFKILHLFLRCPITIIMYSPASAGSIGTDSEWTCYARWQSLTGFIESVYHLKAKIQLLFTWALSGRSVQDKAVPQLGCTMHRLCKCLQDTLLVTSLGTPGSHPYLGRLQ